MPEAGLADPLMLRKRKLRSEDLDLKIGCGVGTHSQGRLSRNRITSLIASAFAAQPDGLGNRTCRYTRTHQIKS